MLHKISQPLPPPPMKIILFHPLVNWFLYDFFFVDHCRKCCNRCPGQEPHRRGRGRIARWNGEWFNLYHARGDGGRSAPGYSGIPGRGVRAKVWGTCGGWWRNQICWSHYQGARSRCFHCHDGLTPGRHLRNPWRVLFRGWRTIEEVSRWGLGRL